LELAGFAEESEEPEPFCCPQPSGPARTNNAAMTLWQDSDLQPRRKPAWQWRDDMNECGLIRSRFIRRSGNAASQHVASIGVNVGELPNAYRLSAVYDLTQWCVAVALTLRAD